MLKQANRIISFIPSTAACVAAEQAERTLSGLDVLDFSLTKRLRRRLDFSPAIDNLTGKRYFETQNYFESRLRPGEAAALLRIHGTPGSPFGLTAGLTFRFFGKN